MKCDCGTVCKGRTSPGVECRAWVQVEGAEPSQLDRIERKLDQVLAWQEDLKRRADRLME